jgi:uncharacterized protein YfdQ (DUF2303 family)
MLSPPFFSPEFSRIFKERIPLAINFPSTPHELESDHGLVEFTDRAINLGATLIAPQAKPDGTGSYVIIPEGMKVHNISDERYIPDHIRQSVQMINPTSLSAYVKAYKDKDGATTIFADPHRQNIAAILNYHTPDKANRIDHNATLVVQFDPIYHAWQKLDGIWIDQVDFARFLEEHAGEITAPDPAQIIEIARSLEVSTQIEFKKAVNLSNDTVQLNFVQQDSTRTAGSFEIPKAVTISTPVYFGGAPQEIKFFFRYSAKNGGLKFKLDMFRKSYIERDAFLGIASTVAADAGVPLYLGRLTS